jgi:hypothetical protein
MMAPFYLMPNPRNTHLGRLTYQIFAAYWPTVTNEEDEIAPRAGVGESRIRLVVLQELLV